MLLEKFFIPSNIKEVIGQSNHILDEDGLLNKIAETKYLPNLILYGPSGCGKTTIAKVLCSSIGMKGHVFNSASQTKSELIEIINYQDTKTVIIIDEAHRMNRNIQDLLINFIDNKNKKIILITTENPYFVINSAIRSRSTLLKMNPVSAEEISFAYEEHIREKIIDKINLSSIQIKKIAKKCGGDLRVFINTLDLVSNFYGATAINNQKLDKILFSSEILSCSYTDHLHDMKSALQKSIRGSDVNASLYYLGLMIKTGNVDSLLRRLLIISYEDIGLANPELCSRVKIAIDAYREVGDPEGRIILSAIVTEMASSPKSNSALVAIDNVLSELTSSGIHFNIPSYLKNNTFDKTTKINGTDIYKYPFDYEHSWVDQTYLPENIKNKTFYSPRLDNVNERTLFHNSIAYKFKK